MIVARSFEPLPRFMYVPTLMLKLFVMRVEFEVPPSFSIVKKLVVVMFPATL